MQTQVKRVGMTSLKGAGVQIGVHIGVHGCLCVHLGVHLGVHGVQHWTPIGVHMCPGLDTIGVQCVQGWTPAYVHKVSRLGHLWIPDT